MSTKSIMRDLHRGVAAEFDEESNIRCGVCEKRIPRAWRSVGDIAVCVWCTKNNGEKNARIKYFVRALTSLPCESKDTDAPDCVVVLNCKCIPCTARSVYFNEVTTYGTYR
jgi:hypothetical protein